VLVGSMEMKAETRWRPGGMVGSSFGSAMTGAGVYWVWGFGVFKG
jgi:hypothetical protein